MKILYLNFKTGNPTYGYGGGTVFSQQMEQNDQTAAITLTEDGQLNFLMMIQLLLLVV